MSQSIKGYWGSVVMNETTEFPLFIVRAIEFKYGVYRYQVYLFMNRDEALLGRRPIGDFSVGARDGGHDDEFTYALANQMVQRHLGNVAEQ